MAFLQADFQIKDDTYLMVQKGLLTLNEGVLRWADEDHKGEIYEIVKIVNYSERKPIDYTTADYTTSLNEKLQAIKDDSSDNGSRIGLIILGVTAAAVVVGTGIYFGYRWYKNRRIKRFNKSLVQYINAVNSSRVDVLTICELKNAIYALKQEKDYERIKVSLSTLELEQLVDKIEEYTVALAKVNDYTLPDVEENDAIIRLEKYLNTQNNVIRKAA